MDREQQGRTKDCELGLVADRLSSWPYSDMLNSGLTSWHNISNIPTTHSSGMYHDFDAPGFSIHPPPIPSRIRMLHDPYTPLLYISHLHLHNLIFTTQPHIRITRMPQVLLFILVIFLIDCPDALLRPSFLDDLLSRVLADSLCGL